MKIRSLKHCACALTRSLTLTHFLDTESKEYKFLIMCELGFLLKGHQICIIRKMLVYHITRI